MHNKFLFVASIAALFSEVRGQDPAPAPAPATPAPAFAGPMLGGDFPDFTAAVMICPPDVDGKKSECCGTIGGDTVCPEDPASSAFIYYSDAAKKMRTDMMCGGKCPPFLIPVVTPEPDAPEQPPAEDITAWFEYLSFDEDAVLVQQRYTLGSPSLVWKCEQDGDFISRDYLATAEKLSLDIDDKTYSYISTDVFTGHAVVTELGELNGVSTSDIVRWVFHGPAANVTSAATQEELKAIRDSPVLFTYEFKSFSACEVCAAAEEGGTTIFSIPEALKGISCGGDDVTLTGARGAITGFILLTTFMVIMGIGYAIQRWCPGNKGGDEGYGGGLDATWDTSPVIGGEDEPDAAPVVTPAPASAPKKKKKKKSDAGTTEGGETPMAPGWTEYEDDRDGTKYYYNDETGQTQWEIPTA